jgi:hypothetical protein
MSDTEKMLEDLLFEKLEADFENAATPKAELPIARRSNFSYGLDALEGGDIRRGFRVKAPETHLEWQISVLEKEAYDDLCATNLRSMCGYLAGLMNSSRVGPFLAISGHGVLQTSTAKSGEYRAFPLHPTQFAFGSLQRVSYGGYHSLENSEQTSVSSAKEINTLPKVFGGMACLETVNVCDLSGKVVRDCADLFIPIHEPGFQFAIAHPIEGSLL